MSTFYEFRMLNIPTKYGLSENSVRMLKAFEDFKTNRLDEGELGRLVRFSPANRAALVDTLQKCIEVMTKNKRETAHCTAIMKSCTEMITIADSSPSDKEFPFMKLPREIRERVYKFCMVNDDAEEINSALPLNSVLPIHPLSKSSGCWCSFHQRDFKWQKFHVRPITLALVSKRMSEEFLRFFYRRARFEFSCTCEMLHHLSQNHMLKGAVSELAFRWCGPKSDVSIAMLKHCPSLSSLWIEVSVQTTDNITKHEKDLEQWFGRRKQLQLSDALGFDELIELRGLKQVTVRHVSKRISDRRSDSDSNSLQRILQDRLLRKRDEDDN